MPRPEALRSSIPAEESNVLRRSLVLAAGLAVWMTLIFARLYYLQIIRYVHWLDRADAQQQRTIEIAAERGTIYDSHMRPLAISLPVNSIYAVPSQIINPHATAQRLGPLLGIEPRDLEGRFEAFRSFCWVKRKVSATTARKVKALDLKGIYFQKENKRFYPMGSLAATVLGYVGMDDRGLAGLEYALNPEIEGKAGRALVMEDARRQTFESKDEYGKPGMDVELTLDSTIQYIAQRVLDRDVAKWHAKGGVAIVQDPDSGAVLAMASAPSFNPNDYAASPPQDRMDRGVAWNYEPGSVFKVITISSAIQAGLARPTDRIDCQMGAIALGGRIIHDAREAIGHERSGDLTLSQVLAYSSDVGAVKIALRLGENRFYDDIRKFGFGAKSDVGLPGEERGLLMPPDRWSGVSIGEIAIGQGIGVTPIQLVDAFSTVANGGVLIQPRIVKRIFRGSHQQPMAPQREQRVLSPQTAATMQQMMEGVVQYGTGRAAQLDGYTAAGKTGTAQKVDPDGRYSHIHFVASFVGFAPASRPAITVLVSIDTPVGGYYGAEVAAPAWQEIAQQTLSYLNIKRDAPLAPPTSQVLAALKSWSRGPGVEAQDPERGLTGADTLEARPDPISPDPPAASQNPGVTMVSAGPEVRVPDLTGLDVRRVAEECQALGLALTVSGSGLAVRQSPTAGVGVPEGSEVQVVFAR